MCHRIMRNAAGSIFVLIALAGCTKHEERDITPWLKVDIRRPVTSGGVVSIGSREDRFEVESGGRWKKLGIGHGSTYMVLGEGESALVDLHDGNGLQLVRADAPPRPVPASLGISGALHVPPGRTKLDVFRAENGTARVERYDTTGAHIASFTFSVPGTYSDCPPGSIAGYDNEGVPFVNCQCKYESAQAKCLLIAPPEKSFLYVVSVDRPWSECDFHRAGMTLRPAEHFTVLQ